jgi:lipopolysaccharide transport system permease protein
MLFYALVFAYIFPARFSADGVVYDYSINVFAGLVSWFAFQDILNRAPTILTGHGNLVKQIVFPTEVLPIKSALSCLLPQAAGLGFVLIYGVAKGHASWLLLTLPWLIFCQGMAMVGVAFLLSAVGVFLRDIRDVVQVFCAINLFAQPIFYNPHAIPAWLSRALAFNPFSHLVWCWQDALGNGAFVHGWAWALLPAESAAVLWLGWWSFQKLHHAFGDAL